MEQALLILLDVVLWTASGYWLLRLLGVAVADGAKPNAWWFEMRWAAPVALLCAVGLLVWIVV